jgi:SPP1 gp7 family putative phage head morphogenesis protein
MRRYATALQPACDCGRVHGFTRDLGPQRARPAPPQRLVKARRVEARYASDLRRIAQQVGLIVEGWAPSGQAFDLSQVPALQNALGQYAEAIRPWARATATRILNEVAIKERASWAEHSRAMSKSLRDELLNAPTGEALRGYLSDQVRLITSLPTEAGQRVHQLTLKGLEDSRRAGEIAREIMRTGEVTQSRANTIARTEVSRTASGLTMVRAQHVGSEAYVWRTSKDTDVRPSHRRMEGKVVAWDDPPTLDGLTGHAGMLPNCRCYPEPIIPEW